MLIDDVTISIKAGNGGNGKVSFKRNAQTAKGGPDGGNGGKGGDVYVQGNNDLTLLQQFQFKKSLRAEDGIGGDKNNLFGRKGKDLVIKVPFGTRITDLATKEFFDIVTEESFLLAKGGKGGLGNMEFKSATNQAPRYAETGVPGQERQLRFELRLIADIGLIGLPNAGKSSLLKELTNADPKIGNYPFTTLEPNLGVMDGIILADIPGLIEGASSGRGLGTKFLKHIEKTRLLLHCIDVSSDDVARDYAVVREEMISYSTSIQQKTEVILLTKRDLVSDKEYAEKEKQLQNISSSILSVSIHDVDRIEKLRLLLKKSVYIP